MSMYRFVRARYIQETVIVITDRCIQRVIAGPIDRGHSPLAKQRRTLFENVRAPAHPPTVVFGTAGDRSSARRVPTETRIRYVGRRQTRRNSVARTKSKNANRLRRRRVVRFAECPSGNGRREQNRLKISFFASVQADAGYRPGSPTTRKTVGFRRRRCRPPRNTADVVGGEQTETAHRVATDPARQRRWR